MTDLAVIVNVLLVRVAERASGVLTPVANTMSVPRVGIGHKSLTQRPGENKGEYVYTNAFKTGLTLVFWLISKPDTTDPAATTRPARRARVESIVRELVRETYNTELNRWRTILVAPSILYHQQTRTLVRAYLAHQQMTLQCTCTTTLNDAQCVWRVARQSNPRVQGRAASPVSMWEGRICLIDWSRIARTIRKVSVYIAFRVDKVVW